jgi:transposase-like protein
LQGFLSLKMSIRPKKTVVREVLGKCLSCEQTALKYGVGRSSLARWVALVRQAGSIDVLERRERKTGIQMGRPRKQEPQTELEKLKLENEYLKAEVALLKKMQALLDSKKAQNKGSGRTPSAS